MNEENPCNSEGKKNELKPHETQWVNGLKEKTMAIMNVEDLDRETARDVERMAVLRVSTKHINLWMRQLEMKRNEICELAGSMGFDEVKNEIASEKASKSGRRDAPITSQGRSKGCCSKKSTIWCGVDKIKEL